MSKLFGIESKVFECDTLTFCALSTGRVPLESTVVQIPKIIARRISQRVGKELTLVRNDSVSGGKESDGGGMSSGCGDLSAHIVQEESTLESKSSHRVGESLTVVCDILASIGG